jgi:hypothetical protein
MALTSVVRFRVVVQYEKVDLGVWFCKCGAMFPACGGFSSARLSDRTLPVSEYTHPQGSHTGQVPLWAVRRMLA